MQIFFEGIDPVTGYAWLGAAVFFTAIISGFIGMFGGILLIGVMGEFVAARAIVPLHGIIQWGSNVSRVWLLWKFVEWKTVLRFAVGGILGAALGGWGVSQISAQALQFAMGAGILLLTWMPKIKSLPKWKHGSLFFGFLITSLSLFVGATGPLVGAYLLREGLKKESMMATQAGCQVFLHFFKVVAFIAIGFPFLSQLHWILLLIGIAFLGNAVGVRIFKMIDEFKFLWIFKGLLTVLGARSILSAVDSD